MKLSLSLSWGLIFTLILLLTGCTEDMKDPNNALDRTLNQATNKVYIETREEFTKQLPTVTYELLDIWETPVGGDYTHNEWTLVYLEEGKLIQKVTSKLDVEPNFRISDKGYDYIEMQYLDSNTTYKDINFSKGLYAVTVYLDSEKD